MARILINGNSFDPSTEVAALRAAGLEAVDASQSNYILIQTSAPLLPDQKEELDQLGVEVQEYVSENTYLCAYKDTELSRIQSLPFVAWANIYLQGFKVSSRLKPTGTPERILSQPSNISRSQNLRTVDVVFHEDVNPSDDAVKSLVAAAARTDKANLQMSRHKVRLTVEERLLDDLAAIDEVRIIEEVSSLKLHNNVARVIINAENVVAGGISYSGEGEIIAVADTGFDKGSASDVHSAFVGRVIRLYELGRPGTADDPDGHGTHVCGSALGDGFSTSMGGAIRGTAPEAQLIMQSLIDDLGGLGGIPFDLGDLFLPPYQDDGARVHTNSWGSTIPGLPYDSLARDIDDFVWSHPDMVICFSAGNDGTDRDGDGIIDASQVGSTNAAKNCITVGASESVRSVEVTYGGYNSTLWPSPPIHDDSFADNASGLAAFSNRGPTQEGRFKPDVVAPGTCILSAHSRNKALPDGTVFGSSTDPDYFFETGTSMATPLVAGCAAVLRETLVKNGISAPGADLIKALLINGAVELPGQYSPSEAGASPNNNSGFGRVDLAGSIIIPGQNPNAGFGTGGPLSQGQEDTIPIFIPSEPPRKDAIANIGLSALGWTYKITLVWSDPPGPDLQNDLDMIVIAADGSERHGNMGMSGGFDRVNNVEQVFWSDMPPGEGKIVVRATRITRFPQPYAYAWRLSG